MVLTFVVCINVIQAAIYSPKKGLFSCQASRHFECGSKYSTIIIIKNNPVIRLCYVSD